MISPPEKTFFSGLATLHAGDPNQRFVTALYQDLLHRQPDPIGLQTFAGQLAGGTPRSMVVQTVISSAEADMNLSQRFIGSLYRDLLSRPAGNAECMAFWPIMQGPARQVVVHFLSSQEYFTRAQTR